MSPPHVIVCIGVGVCQCVRNPISAAAITVRCFVVCRGASARCIIVMIVEWSRGECADRAMCAHVLSLLACDDAVEQRRRRRR